MHNSPNVANQENRRKQALKHGDPESGAVASLSVEAGGKQCSPGAGEDVEDEDDESSGFTAVDLGISAAW